MIFAMAIYSDSKLEDYHSETDSGIPHMTLDSKNTPDIPNISKISKIC